MKEINITKHALMRYASRVHKANIISDRTWDIWKKANEDKIEVLEASLKEEFKRYNPVMTQRVARDGEGIVFTDEFGVKNLLDDGLVIGFGAGDITYQLRGDA